VAHEPPPVPAAEPQAEPAIVSNPVLSTWTHLVPEPESPEARREVEIMSCAVTS